MIPVIIILDEGKIEIVTNLIVMPEIGSVLNLRGLDCGQFDEATIRVIADYINRNGDFEPISTNRPIADYKAEVFDCLECSLLTVDEITIGISAAMIFVHILA